MSSWATQRKVILIIVAVSLVAAVAVLIAIPFLYKTPSCMDGKQNQGENGIDCGGSCAYICTADAAVPNVRFVRALSQLGRTDVVAYVDNRNQDAAAKNAPYVIEVYDETQTLVGKREGVMDLAPGMTTPLFVSAIQTGTRQATQAFVTFDAEKVKWYRYEGRPAIPNVSETRIQEDSLPRVTATLQNKTPKAFLNVAAVVTVFDEMNNAIAASRTVMGVIPAGGETKAVFTWPAPFTSKAVRVEVLPVPVP